MKMTTRLALAGLTGAGLALGLQTIQRQSRKMDFKKRVVVITGGSRGLGLVMAHKLAEEGAYLALLARDPAELERAEAQLAPHETEVFTISCDVSRQEEVEAAIERVIECYGRLDVLINNAGVIQVGPFEHMTTRDFEQAMAVHFWGPLYTTLAALPYMRQQGGGRIVNISSIGGKVSVPHLLPYSTSKFALVGLSDGLRAELTQDRIFVTTVCPGLMRTGSHFNALFKGQHESEFTWFSILDALPITSTTAQNAARQIIEACRYGDPEVVITLQARLAALANELAPRWMATGLALFNRFLPAPTTAQGDTLETGWESQSEWAPSVLTHLADQATIENNGLQGHTPEATFSDK
jgi:NAD(P)-dependent dehydrogenase (short-subunit alcohol dehydrogenase family)